jgi:AAA family ATP:ADP antiporter
VGFVAARKGERRDVWAAFLTLFAIIASHSVLETGRDAIFLSKLPATRLPWVYLAIAALSFGAAKLDARATRGRSPRRVLTSTTLSTSAVTLAFFALHRRIGTTGVYALYVWSGLLATLLLVHFWDLVSARFTITQAKRLYGFVGAGGVAGAIAGSGTATLLSRFFGPEKLVLVAALGFAAAGVLPFLFREEASLAPPEDSPVGLGDSVRAVARNPYARQLVATLFIATVCLTVSDFVFKSTIAELVPQADLGTFLGSVYLGINVLSLFAQIGLVTWILKRLSLGAALGVLPALLVVTGLGVAVAASLAAVIALKAADGSLRYSLHRTTSELLFFPFGDEGRRVKASADLISQRGGQMLASVAILGLGALHAHPRSMAFGLVALSCAWLAAALALRKPYVALFRARLRAARSSHVSEFPALDVTSLETLLQALESDNDREVLAALSVLERENKARLVPALLLHHPSEPVVLRVLGILAHSNRKSAAPVMARIIAKHPSASVRAAAVAARSVLESDPEKLRGLLETEESAEIRAAIAVNLIVSGALPREDSDQLTEALLRAGSTNAQIAFAEAIRRRSAPGFDHVLVALSAAPETEVRRAAVAAMGSVPSPALLPELVRALAHESTRGAAEHALAAHGREAFEVLREHLEDTTTGANLRWHIPAAMALCSPEPAIKWLLTWLPREPDGSVRFATLLVLERLVRQHPTLSVDRTALHRSISATIGRAFWFLDMRVQLARGAAQDGARRTPGYELLHDLLRDKEVSAQARLFRLLGLLHPSEDMVHIHRSLNVNKELRATSVELIESILREPLRSAVLGLVDDCLDHLRLLRAGPYHRPQRLGYGALIAHLAKSDSTAVREVAQFHSAELAVAGSVHRAGAVA